MSSFYKISQLAQDKNILKLQWEYNSSSFGKWLMSEIAHKLARELNNWADENPDELPFQDMFNGNETRKIINFEKDEIATSIIDKIKKMDCSIDPKTNTITNNTTGKAIRAGKFILSYGHFDDKEKKWWTTQPDPMHALRTANFNSNKDYSIIVSRNPVDIARMSDHDGWSSCHSPNGSYFQCAISDAKGAGAIAYVVNRHDLAGLDLQQPEIFKDSHRGQHGIEPISRIRLRKFVHKDDDYDLAVPEERHYGKFVPEFEDTVKNWARDSQKEKFGDERPRMKDFQLMGGSYQDTSASELFNNFFDDDEDSGEAEYGGEDEYTNMADQYEEEINIIDREFRDKFKHCWHSASVEMADQEPYVFISGGFSITVPHDLINTDFPYSFDRNVYDDKDAYKTNREIEREVKKCLQDNYVYPEEISIEEEDEGITFRFDLNTHEEENDGHPDAYRSFLDNTLKDIEDKFDEIQGGLYKFLIQKGWAAPNKHHELIHNPESNHNFEHFKWTSDEDDHYVFVSMKEPMNLGNFVLGTLVHTNETLTSFTQKYETELNKQLNASLNNFITKQNNQPRLFPVPEKEQKKNSFHITPKIALEMQHPNGNNYGSGVFQNLIMNKDNTQYSMVMKLSMDFKTFDQDDHVEDAIKFIQYLDTRFTIFQKTATNIYNQLMQPLLQRIQTLPVPNKTDDARMTQYLHTNGINTEGK